MTDRPIVANIIARNEASSYLVPVLERLKSQVDMIVFTDDCSDDDTPNIAQSFGAKVFQMTEPTFKVNEGRIRQQSWENLETVIPSEDCFILAIDCDEMLYETRYTLQQLANQDNFNVINIEFYHMWNENQFRIDKAWRPHPSSRMFRYLPGGRFLDRQLACGSEPTYVQQLIKQNGYFRDSGLMMKHLSYIKDVDKQAKYDRYMALDGGAFHANAHIISIMDQEPTLIDWMWED
jgi:glycosyltransferase involved in cell wall biosynthesis